MRIRNTDLYNEIITVTEFDHDHEMPDPPVGGGGGEGGIFRIQITLFKSHPDPDATLQEGQ